ncbi:MAG: hypothetical protein JSR26_13140 [Proteobacteria bacterium]|nr:hypothetical protein [Pseudomonadota bacterium]
MADDVINPVFVDLLPQPLERGVLYISIRYKTMAHLCCCGCGSKVVTPLSPTGWSLIYNGKEASLRPSIGNWSLPCRSHYWILKNRVEWAESWSQERVAAGFNRDVAIKQRYHHDQAQEQSPPAARPADAEAGSPLPREERSTIRKWLSRLLS